MAPPPSKAEISGKKKPLSRQQIAIYVVSALVVLIMAIGFVISGLGTTPTATPAGGGDVNIQELLATPAPGEEPAGDAAGDAEPGGDTVNKDESATE